MIAARDEVPPGCANVARSLRDDSPRLHEICDAVLTPAARQVLALGGSADRRRLLANIAEGRLVFLEPRTPRPLRSTPPIRRRPQPEPDTPGLRATEKTSWIRLRVVDNLSSRPLPGVVLRVTTPDGKTFEYTTRADGMIDIQEIDPGACTAACSLDEARITDTYGFVTIGDRPPPLSTAAGDAEQADSREIPSIQPNPGQGEPAAPPPSLRGARIAGVEAHKVRTGESIRSLAEANGLTWQELARFNWDTDNPDEINNRLRDDVGCTRKAHDGVNYRFDDADEPGIVHIPKPWSATGLATERQYTIRVRTLDRASAGIAYIRLRVWDEDEQPVAKMECVITDLGGAEIFTGATDATGCIRKDDVPFDDFRLAIDDYERMIPSVAYDDEWIDVFIPPRGYLRVLVHGPSQEALAGAAFSVADLQGRKILEGATDAQGRVKRDRVKLDDYRLTVGEFERIIPAVSYDDEWIDVFTEPAASSASPESPTTKPLTADATNAGA